ncbi:MAG: hypothetical protein KME47_22400 [Nodosilinea sp. WJT8-NPBG4]|jgi:hypothetical protein|nr:hypothetical protein [Nodosilinea sp. WJT8-NPBG4]
MLRPLVPEISDVHFQNGKSAQVLSLSDQTTSLEALGCMGLPMAQPTLVIIGGASLMSAESMERLQTVFDQVFAPLAQSLGLTVLDGGTDTGVIHMMGQARQSVGGNFTLIGVVPQGKTRLPSDRHHDDSLHDLEPNHTHFFLIPGDEWGSESPWLAKLASQISVGRPALTILVNGGQIALIDLKENLATGRPAIVMSGSGRLADSIAAPLPETDPAILELIQRYQPNGKLEIVDLSLPVDQMRDRLQQYFSSTLS